MLTAMQDYDTTVNSASASWRMQELQSQNEYATAMRTAEFNRQTTQRQAAGDLQLSLLNAAFDEWDAQADFDFTMTSDRLSAFESALAELDSENATGDDFDDLIRTDQAIAGAQSGLSYDFRNGLAATKLATETAARDASELANRDASAAYTTSESGAFSEYALRSLTNDASYEMSSVAAYVAYVSIVDAASHEFEAERCRLEGLLYDSVNTGVNTVEGGTSSLVLVHRVTNRRKLKTETAKPEQK